MEPTTPNPSEPTPETPTVAETPQPTQVPEPVVTTEPIQPSPVTEPLPVEPAASTTPSAPATPEVGPTITNETPLTNPAPVFAPAGEPVANGGLNPGRTLGIVSLILSIIGISVVGIILGIIGLRKSKKAGFKNGFALAGIIVGAVEFVIGVIVLIALISIGGSLLAKCQELGTGTHVVDGVTYTCS